MCRDRETHVLTHYQRVAGSTAASPQVRLIPASNVHIGESTPSRKIPILNPFESNLLYGCGSVARLYDISYNRHIHEVYTKG